VREIKFRGKRVDNGEWVYGAVLETSMSGVYIIGTKKRTRPSRTGISIGDIVWQHEVMPETVGQFTGLHDKSGKEIYEGDIVTASWYDYDEPNHDTTGEVIFAEGWMAYTIWDEENKIMSELNGQGCYKWDIEVIGNIHENPDLLEVPNA
jgi:uncharacterized phage protein (TIGR01671 family)